MQTNPNKPNWAHYFNIDDETFKKLEVKAIHLKCTPLDLALDMGLINENKAMAWFRDQCGLPSLKDVFFNAQPPTQLWQEEHYQSCRAAACLPVANWDGVIYWAKLSNMPTGFEISHPGAIWVLAPWSGIKKWFDAWKAILPAADIAAVQESPGDVEALKETSATQDDFSAPVGFSSQITSDNLDIDFSSIGVDDGTSSNEAAPTQTNHDQGAPAATAAETNADGELMIDFNLSGEDSPAVQTVPRVAPTPILNKEPMPISKLASAPAPTPVPATARNPEIDGPQIIKPMSISMPAPPMPPIPTAAGAVEIKPVGFTMPQAAPNLKPANPAPNMPPPPVVQAAQAAPMAAGPLIPTIPIEQIETYMAAAPTQDGLANVLMAGWQNYFQQLLVLLFQQDHLILWWNNNRWPGKFERGEPILLDTPSIFKIVADTAQPYHGHVCSGPINDDFFRKVNNGNYPDHVTVVPVKAGDRVVAMLLGTCEKDAGKKIQLDRLEVQAAQFSDALVKLMAPKKQAS